MSICPALAQGRKFKDITPKATPPALSDQIIGVTGGTTDNLYTLSQIQSTISSGSAGIAPLGTLATSIGVDCTDATDSTTAIQTWVNANPSGRLIFPIGCTFFTSATILAHNTENLQFAGVPNQFGIPTVVWYWKGSNGGAACAINVASCKFMIDFEDSGYPVVTDIQMVTNPDWATGGNSCPDGFIRADEDGLGNTTTQGLFQNLYLDNTRCHNEFLVSTDSTNFMGISLSASSQSNVENFTVNNVFVACGGTYRDDYVADAVTNSTTTVTSATANFQNAYAGRIVSVSYAGGRFDTTIASVTNSTTIVLAQAVPWSQSNVTLIVNQPIGVGIFVGQSANSIQHLFNQINYFQCAAGMYLASGNAQIVQPKSGHSTYGIYIGNAVQNVSIDQYAAEGDFEGIHSFGVPTPVILSNGRLTNTHPLASGFVSANGKSFTFINNFFDFGGAAMNANAIQMNPGYRMAPTAIGTIIGGSGYVDGVYTNVALSNPYFIDHATADITVSGGAVTSVTLKSDPGNFNAFRIGGVLTTFNAFLGGSGSGFSVVVTAMNFQIGNPGDLTTIGNDFTGGTGPTTFTQSGLAAWNTVPSTSRWTSISDNFGSQTVASAQPGGTVFSCGGDAGPQSCAFMRHTGQPGSSSGKDLYGMEIFTTRVAGGEVQSGTTSYLAHGDSGSAVASDWTGFKSIPTSGVWVNPSSLVDFQASNDLATGITLPGGSLYSFKANTASNVVFFGVPLKNAYGLYVDSQTTTNVTNGFGIWQNGPSDINFFAGTMVISNNVSAVSYASSGIAGVSCSGTFSPATATITNGIITHC